MSEDIISNCEIDKEGYGNIPKMVMQDKKLSALSKAVYAYFCSFTGAGDSCFPTREKICYDLGISNNSLSKYLKELIENNYLIVKQIKENGRFSHNVYTLPRTKLPYTKIFDTENTVYGNLHTKNNNLKNNSIIKNNNFNKKENKKRKGENDYEKVI